MNETVRCRGCNRSSDEQPAAVLSWVRDSRPGGGVTWLCPDCARDNLRSIEAKLPDEWW